MRATVTIAPAKTNEWAIAAAWPGGGAESTATRLPGRPWIAPADGPPDDVPTLSTAIDQLMTTGEAREGAPVEVGRYLHGCLLADTTWTAILDSAGEEVLELALRCEDEARQLHDLPWELLHDGRMFVARLLDHPVVVTRIVAPEAPVDPVAVPGPPSVLFAIGSRLTDRRVRAGAEFMALLRELDARGGHAMDPFVVQDVSLDKLKRAVERVRPTVLYLISHGRSTPAGAELELRDNGDPGQAAWASGRMILDALREAGHMPGAVLLSACDGAVANGALSASLAGQLVAGGAPVVMAMSGRITDQACRLFMRRFAAALVEGRPLIDAAAEARRAAYRETGMPTASADWALPCLFLAEGVEHGFAAVRGTRERTAGELIGALGLQVDDVFCGRGEFFAAYDELVSTTDNPHVLLARSPAEDGIGRRRLLKELGAQALRDGHVPLLVEEHEIDGVSLRTTRELAVRVLEAAGEVRRALDLPTPAQSVILEELGAAGPAPTGDVQADRRAFRRALAAQRAGQGEVAVAALREAFAADLHALAHEAGESGWAAMGAHTRPLLLFSHVEAWDRALTALVHGLLGRNGIGVAGTPVPVVATWEEGAGDQLLAPYWDRNEDEGWSRFLWLRRFKEDGEDVLAYEWRLLQPKKIEGWAYSSRVYAVRTDTGRWLDLARMKIGGLPSMLADPDMWMAAMAAGEGEVVEGDDDDCIKVYQERGMQR